MTRAVMLLHRYLGIAISILMVAWCLSGIVMMYVGFPSFDAQSRLATLPALQFGDCCRIDAARAAIGDFPVNSFRFEMLLGRPVLRLSTHGEQTVVDLRAGTVVDQLDAGQARQIAAEYVRMTRTAGAPSLLGLIERDQWTVSGGYDVDRPLYKFALRDRAGTEIYVASENGEVVQLTTRRQRLWNWCGAVLHWLYFTPLRAHPQAWSQVIIWLAGAGVFLTVAGIYLGIARVRWHQDRVRWTPFRGMNLWHHVLGLVFGLLALTWVGSGLLSMNPWGLLESDYGADERTALQGVELSSSSALVVAATLAREGLPRAGGATPVQISSAPLAGRLYLLITAPGQRQRFDAATLTASVLTPQEIAQAFHGLGPQAQPALPVLLRQGDAYYHSDHEDDFEPAYRVLSGGPEPSSYYFDTVDGALLLKFDPPARGYRWWFNALHRWDFSPTLRRRPLWDLVVVSLLLGVSGLCVTGLVLGWRRVTD